MPTVEVNGARLWYDEAGSGPPLMLLHGGLGDSGLWEPVVPFLSGRFRTIRTDVQVYRGESIHEVTYLRERYDLQKWGCALLRGEDKYHLNRMIQPPTYAKPELVATAASN